VVKIFFLLTGVDLMRRNKLAGRGKNSIKTFKKLEVKMIKKTLKIILIVMMLIGAFIAVSNLLQKDVYAGKWVKYLPEVPDCKGEGHTCYDMTSPDG
jgi:hypothetical protein